MGNENAEYTNDANNMQIFALVTMIKHVGDIEKHLKSSNESAFIRINEHDFIEDDGTQEIYIIKK